jgi:hypothetical protein
MGVKAVKKLQAKRSKNVKATNHVIDEVKLLMGADE